MVLIAIAFMIIGVFILETLCQILDMLKQIAEKIDKKERDA